jgi:cell division protease FtsH
MRRSLWLLLIPALLAAWWAEEFLSEPAPRQAPNLAYSDLMKDLASGNLRDLTLRGRAITGSLSNGRAFQSFTPLEPQALVERALEAGVHVIARPAEEDVNPLLHYILAWAPYFLWLWLLYRVALRLIHRATEAQAARIAQLESRLAAFEAKPR